MNPDDKSLFLDAMEDVQSLKRCADIHWQPSRNTRTRQALNTEQLDNFLTLGFLELLPLAEPLAFQREGVQQGVIDKLRSGKYSRQASINFIRQPVEQCRQMLFSFIRQAERDGLRNLVIVHGKGREEQSHPNVVRSYLARWLTEFDSVQAFCVALPHHGGSGACYVALRKSDEARLENRERHAKRSR
ncbi:DNA endonuclease SmrA [Enterobacter sp. RHBSTW-00175]|uniref:DNA endonuclease SmrA n=1 Tax=Enterobacter sp. RHBSTW-00175 TaxID=2742639 RepID=UPI0015EA1DBE|nr:DNA endonuclease SmrA [Enterobacter sp. RHBSTW-00175]HDR2754029.1 DNA endonuclease SmrA [Enterobacter asburiae]QMR78081.1 DNA endonuclease SmrA [Enterobacter sp. RHBSTW-00175]HDR2787529.1 DNA endonuclease SmrA [Enterobacter asburiae]HDR2803769.1 DNA endonuclease SmrA [Enterobacter asburiae]HDR2809096.1 DNA endonuclease SmrA [Enterobacter asburiae]